MAKRKFHSDLWLSKSPSIEFCPLHCDYRMRESQTFQALNELMQKPRKMLRWPLCWLCSSQLLIGFMALYWQMNLHDQLCWKSRLGFRHVKTPCEWDVYIRDRTMVISEEVILETSTESVQLHMEKWSNSYCYALLHCRPDFLYWHPRKCANGPRGKQ